MSPASHLACSSFLIGLISCAVATAGEEENWTRLRSMPRDHRVYLSEKLEEFDKLPRAEQEAIRKLEAEIANRTPSEQANYRAVLRRYRLWLATLTETQRQQLAETPPGAERLRLVDKIRAATRVPSEQRDDPLYLHMSDLSGPSPFTMAHAIKIWFALSPGERAELDRLPQGPDRMKRLVDLGRSHKLKPEDRPSQGEEVALLKRMEEDPHFKTWTNTTLRKIADPVKHKAQSRLADNYYFIEHPPRKVEATNLLRFESALPSWLRSPFDHLPPDEARRRLTILYRLVYPHPGEMPAAPVKPASPATAPGTPGPSPAPAPGSPDAPREASPKPATPF